jgi:hypothetical protein
MTCLTLFLQHNGTEDNHLFQEQIITLGTISNVREMDPPADGNIKAVWLFLIIWSLLLQIEKFGLYLKRQTS